MKLKWLGHSAFELVSDNGLDIIVDPFIQANPACPLNVNDIHPDVICITHGHSDHFGDVVEIARNNPNLVVVTNYEISIHLQREGVNSVGINCGAEITINDVKIRMLDAKHSSSLDFDINIPYAGNPGSFLFTFENDLKVFHAGDTGLFSDMKFVIGEVYKPDIAILPIGNIFTMNPTEASIATSWISPKVVIPMHYNSFPSIRQDPDEFKREVESRAPDCETLIAEVLRTYEF